MSKPAFTPGPWGLEGNHLWIMAGHLHVATVPRAGDGDWSPANAHLISAAPDMYEALRNIIEMNVQYAIDRYGDASQAEDMACVRVARAALAKADGAQ